MANPITWRNINSPSNHSATELMRQSGSSFNKAFDGITSTIQGLQDRERNENTQRFLDTVAQYRTPDSLDQADTSGLFQKLLSEADGNIDRSAVRNAVSDHRGKLMDQVLASKKYDQYLRQDAEAPLVDDLTALYRAGKVKEGDKLRAGKNFTVDNQLATERTAALDKAYKKAISDEDRSRTKVLQDRQDVEWGRKHKSYRLSDDLKASENSIPGFLGKNINSSGQPIAGKTETQLENEYLAEVGKAYPDFGPSELSRLRDQFRQLRTNSLSISPLDEAKYQKDVEDTAKAYDMGTNPFYTQQDYIPFKEAASIISENQKKLESLDDADLSGETVDELIEVMTKGIVIDGIGERFQVPPDLLRIALSKVESGWFSDKTLKDAIPELLKKANVEKYLNEYNAFKKEKNTLELHKRLKYRN